MQRTDNTAPVTCRKCGNLLALSERIAGRCATCLNPEAIKRKGLGADEGGAVCDARLQAE